MPRFYIKYYLKMLKIFLLLLLLILPTFYSLIRPGFFPMQDDLQAFRVHQMVKCLSDLQIPCRWIPDMGYQYGYPQFNFYPPSIFYLGGLLNILGIQVIDTVKILFILGFVLSAVTMFVFLKAMFGSWPAFVGAMLYSYAPYKATEVYVRGALSEFWSFVFFPLIFWSIFQLINQGKVKYLIWLALSTALLLTTHNLMSFIFLPLSLIWAISQIIIWKKWKVFPKVFFAFLLGLGVASFFTIPVIFEGKFVHLETLTGGYFDWRQHFVSVKQLFLSNHFGYGSSYLGANDDLSLSTGIIHWALGLLAVVLALFNLKKMKELSGLMLMLGVLELAVLFLLHQRSTFIWENIPAFSLLQFPWRFLSDSTFILSVLGAFAIYNIESYGKKVSLGSGITIIVLLFILHAPIFQPKAWLNISDSDKFSGQNWEKQLTISIFDYLPVYAKLPPNKKAPLLPDTLDGQADLISFQKGSNYQKGEIDVKKTATIRLPLFDFPGMEVRVDGGKVNHWYDDCRGQEYCLGLITFNVPEGRHKIEARLEDTPVRKISNIITVASVLILMVILFRSKKNEKFT